MQPDDALPDKALARRSFEAAAARYDAAAVLQREVGNRLLERLDVMRIRPRRILELGAGTGYCIPGLFQRFRNAEVVALDIAWSMLVQTRRRGRWLRRPRCVCADAERLPFADKSFDLVFSNLTLQWCTDLRSVLSELQRVLTPGGLLLFTTLGPDTLRELRDSWRRVDGFSHVNAFLDMHDVGDELVRTRFADPVMDVERLTLTYTDVMRLMRDLKQLGAHNVTAGRPRGLTGKAHLRRLIEAYERYRREGLLPATYEIVHGHAWSTSDEISVPVDSVRRK